MRARQLAVLAVVLGAIGAYEVYALFIKRSGETAYVPEPADSFLSVEIAGDITLQQTFVMHADGLETVRLHPARSAGTPQGRVQLTLHRDNWVQPFAVSSWPAERLVQGDVFDWHVPRVEESAGRTFTIGVSIPDAPPGHGLRFRAGVPRYVQGELLIGQRPEWGDLEFATTAARARVIDTMSALRRRTPLLQSDVVFVLTWLVFNAALTVLVVHAIAAASHGD